MSNIKRSILIFYLVALIATCTYVPWLAGTQQNNIPAGYSFVWQPPQNYVIRPSLEEIWSSSTTAPKFSSLRIIGIDFNRLTLEIIGVTAITGVLFLISSYKANKS